MILPRWDGGDHEPPLLLFDLNGTLTSHTAARNSSGITRLRPCIHLLRKLQVRAPSVLPVWVRAITLHIRCT
jgi:hypothetical protein